EEVRTTTETQVVATQQAVPEDRSVAILDLMAIRIEADRIRGVVRVRHPAESRAAFGVPEPVRSDAYHRIELRRPAHATLRDDLDHAVRRLRAVQRRRGRTLDDLDALDVGRVDVVEPTHVGAAALGWPAPGIAVHADPIDVNDRLVPLRQ